MQLIWWLWGWWRCWWRYDGDDDGDDDGDGVGDDDGDNYGDDDGVDWWEWHLAGVSLRLSAWILQQMGNRHQSHRKHHDDVGYDYDHEDD